jgi:predicted lipoprotein
MKRFRAIRLVWLGVLALLIYHSLEFQNLEEHRAQARAQQFNAADYARDLWDSRLPGILDQAMDAQFLLALFNTDMPAAIKQGRTLGESRTHAYLMKGQGRIVGQHSKGLLLSVADPGDRPEIVLRTGAFISGNAVRDASGLVDVSAFDDTMKFNRISFEINKILVQAVIAPFLEQTPEAGQVVGFVGAAEVAEDATEARAFGDRLDTGLQAGQYHLLQLVPIRLSLKQTSLEPIDLEP